MSFADDFRAMSPEERKAWMQEAAEREYKRNYEATLSWLGETGPAWEDMTEDQRSNIRAEIDRHAQEMHEFGKTLAGDDAPKFSL